MIKLHQLFTPKTISLGLKYCQVYSENEIGLFTFGDTRKKLNNCDATVILRWQANVLGIRNFEI